MKAVFLQSAATDLRELRRYFLRQFGEPVWREHSGKLKAAVKLIAKTPEADNVPDEIRHLGLPQFRHFLVGQTRLIYEINRERVVIHLVCDTRRDLRTLLSQRLLRP